MKKKTTTTSENYGNLKELFSLKMSVMVAWWLVYWAGGYWLLGVLLQFLWQPFVVCCGLSSGDDGLFTQ